MNFSPLLLLKKNELMKLAKINNITNINNRMKKQDIQKVISNELRNKNKYNKSCYQYNIKGRRNYNEDEIYNIENSKYIISAVFDGHGGNECSLYLKNNFIKYFDAYLDKKLFNGNFIKILKDIVIKLNQRFLNNTKYNSGSTANILLIDKINGMFYCANIGDSRLISNCYKSINKSGVKQISKDHNFNYKKEIQLVESYNGYIKDDRLNGRLAMSRAIGDREISNNMCQEPDIIIGNCKYHNFFIQGSDGLFDELSNKKIIKYTKKLLDNNVDIKLIPKYLCEFAFKSGSGDNISCSLVFIPDIF